MFENDVLAQTAVPISDLVLAKNINFMGFHYMCLEVRLLFQIFLFGLMNGRRWGILG